VSQPCWNRAITVWRQASSTAATFLNLQRPMSAAFTGEREIDVVNRDAVGRQALDESLHHDALPVDGRAGSGQGRAVSSSAWNETGHGMMRAGREQFQQQKPPP